MPANLPSTVTLQRGETLMLANQGTSDDQTVWEDLTGTSIVSNEKVAVFAGHACTNINTTACDHLIEQLPPVTSLGRRFLTVPLATRHSGDVFRVVANNFVATSSQCRCQHGWCLRAHQVVHA